MRGFRWILIASVVASVGFFACVGDDATTTGGNAGAGDESGPCFPNKTCSGTLTCVSDRCVDLGKDGGTDGTTGDGSSSDAGDAGGGDAGGGDAGDAGDGACAPTQAPNNTGGLVVCTNALSCSGDAGLCCQSGTAGMARSCVESAAQCGAATTMGCVSSVPCSTGQICCGNIVVTPTTTCPREATMNTSKCDLVGACATGTIELCEPTRACQAGKTCQALKILVDPPTASYLVGACL